MDQQNLITNVNRRRPRQQRQFILVSTSTSSSSSFSAVFLFFLYITLVVIIGAVEENNSVLEVVNVTESVAGEQEILYSSNDFNVANRLPATVDTTDEPNAGDIKNVNATIHKESDDGDNDIDNEEEITKSDEIITSTRELPRDNNSYDEGDVIGSSAMGKEIEENVSTIKTNLTSKFSTNNKRSRTEDHIKEKNEMEKNVVNEPVANNDYEQGEKRNTSTTSTSSLKMTKTIEVRKKNEMETEKVSKKMEMKGTDVNKPLTNDNEGENKRSTSTASTSPSTSPSKMTKTEEVQKKKEMEGVVNNPMAKYIDEANRTTLSPGSLKKNKKTEEVNKKIEMKDADVNKPLTNNNEEEKKRSTTTSSTAPSKMTKTEEVHKKKEMEGVVNNPMARDIIEANRTTIPPSSLKKNKKTEEVNKKMEMEDNINKPVTNNIEEKEKRNTITTSTLPSKMERIEIVQKKREMKGIVNNPIVTISSSSSEKNTKAAEGNKKMEMEDDFVIKLVKLDAETMSEEEVEIKVEVEIEDNAPYLEEESKMIEQNEGKSTSSFDTMNNTFHVYQVDNDDDSVIDLDFGTKEENLKVRQSTVVVVEVKEEIKQEQDPVDLIMNNNNDNNISTISKGSEDNSSEINATAQDFSISGIDATNNTTARSEEKKEPPKGSLASFFENAKMRPGVGTDSVIRQAQLLGEKQEQHESPTTIVINGYRGEPWGQYRSTRRLPDLELLRLVFEDANNSGTNRGKGDANSQKVLEEWQTNPLYEDNMTMEAMKSAKDHSVAGVGAAFPIEEQERKLYEYRTRKLSDNDDNVANTNPNAKGTDDRKNDINSIDSNQNKKNNADVKSEFVEGLDDIDDFFEGVDPPDELDVGFGSSIQDVLMDKGKHILLKKIRGVIRRIQISYQKMGHNLKERVSQFQSPFHRSKETISVASDLKADTTNSSLNANPNKQHDERTIRDAIISAWTVGKRTLEQTSDWMDRLLDRFDGRSDDDSTNFEDFNGFDLDNLPTLIPPKPDL